MFKAVYEVIIIREQSTFKKDTILPLPAIEICTAQKCCTFSCVLRYKYIFNTLIH